MKHYRKDGTLVYMNTQMAQVQNLSLHEQINEIKHRTLWSNVILHSLYSSYTRHRNEIIGDSILLWGYVLRYLLSWHSDIAHERKTCAVINNSPLLAAVDFHNQDMDRNSMPCPPDRRGSPTTTSIARSAARVTRPTKGTVNPFGPLFPGNTARVARFTPNFPSSTPNA